MSQSVFWGLELTVLEEKAAISVAQGYTDHRGLISTSYSVSPLSLKWLLFSPILVKIHIIYFHILTRAKKNSTIHYPCPNFLFKLSVEGEAEKEKGNHQDGLGHCWAVFCYSVLLEHSLANGLTKTLRAWDVKLYSFLVGKSKILCIFTVTFSPLMLTCRDT